MCGAQARMRCSGIRAESPGSFPVPNLDPRRLSFLEGQLPGG